MSTDTRPCYFCGKPIAMIPNGYTVVWDNGRPSFAHDKCAEESGQVSPMSGAEIIENMKPIVDDVFATLKKIFEPN